MQKFTECEIPSQIWQSPYLLPTLLLSGTHYTGFHLKLGQPNLILGISKTSVKVQIAYPLVWLVVSAGSLVRVQLRFSLCSGAIITRCWFQCILYWSSSPSSAVTVLCLLPNLLRGCSCWLCLLFLCRSLLVVQLSCSVGLSAVLGFFSLFYTT